MRLRFLSRVKFNGKMYFGDMDVVDNVARSFIDRGFAISLEPEVDEDEYQFVAEPEIIEVFDESELAKFTRPKLFKYLGQNGVAPDFKWTRDDAYQKAVEVFRS